MFIYILGLNFCVNRVWKHHTQDTNRSRSDYPLLYYWHSNKHVGNEIGGRTLGHWRQVSYRQDRYYRAKKSPAPGNSESQRICYVMHFNLLHACYLGDRVRVSMPGLQLSPRLVLATIITFGNVHQKDSTRGHVKNRSHILWHSLIFAICFAS